MVDAVVLAFWFHRPGWLWLLVGLAALAGVYIARQIGRTKYTARFTNLALLDSIAPRRPGWRRHLAAGAFAVGLAVLVLAVAQPRYETKVPRNRATIVLAIDTSLSMQATDVDPNRLDAAKDAADRFLEIVPPDINVGLVSFNGTVTIEAEPTTDRELVAEKIDSLQLDERTAIGDGIHVSLEAIDRVPPPADGKPVPAHIVLLSDGSTTTGRSNAEGAQEAAEQDVPVDTIAFGTDHGTVEVDGQRVDVSVDREALEDIADATGGENFDAASSDQVRDVYESIGESIGYDTVTRELTVWFEGAALAVLAVAAALSLAWSNRLL